MRQRYVPADVVQVANDECAFGNGGRSEEGVSQRGQLISHVSTRHAHLTDASPSAGSANTDFERELDLHTCRAIP
jgi:hypothetical protein